MAAFDDIRRGFEAAHSVVSDAIGNRAAQYLKRSLDVITPSGKPIEPVKVPPQDQIIQVPNYRTGLLGPIGWTVDAVRSALASHAGGTFVGTGLLADDFFLHPVFAKCIQERENIFSLMPRMCTAARERDKQARYVRDWFEEIRPEVYSDAILRDIHRDCLQMGFAVVGIDWEERKDGQHRWWLPVLKPWHPALVQYFYRGIGRSVDGGCFNATTLNKGLLTVEPGLGRWMLVQRGLRQPWLKGAVYSLGYDWIGDENNFFDNLAFEERFGLGVMSYYHDETYQRGQVNQSTTNIANMGAAAVIPLRMRNGQAMEKLELLATSGSGWQSFDQTEKRILTRTLLYYLGQDLTSIGQPGGLGQAQASEHKNTLWSKYEESCSWFLDGQRVVERDEQTGDEMVRWEPKEGELYKQVSKWIGWFNFRRWDIMPRVWLDATPPDQQQEREVRQSKAVGEKAKTIGALAGAMETLQKVLPEVTPRQWFEASNLLPDQDAIAERQDKKKKQAPTPADEQPTDTADKSVGDSVG